MSSNAPIVLRNILNEQTLSIVQQYFKHKFALLARSGHIELGDPQEPLRFSLYGEPLAQTIMRDLTPIYSEALGIDLQATHSYMSLYVPGSELKRHQDRPECEYTATITIYSEPGDFVWPVYVETPEGGEHFKVELTPGDTAIYRGCDCPHWRDQQEEGYNISIFFHFVDPSGDQMDNPKAHEADKFVASNFSKEIRLSEKLDELVQDKRSEKNKSIVLVFGRLCSGKGTFCQPYLKQGYNHTTTSDIVKRVSGKSTRSELTKTADLDTQIAEEMIAEIEKSQPIIVDGIRQKSIVERILAHFGESNVELIWLEVPADIRRQRFTSRAASKDDQSFDDAEQSDSKLGIDNLESSIKGRSKIVNFH